MKRFVGIALCVWIATATPPAQAQDMGWSTTMPAITGTDTLGLVLREQMERRRAPTAPPSQANPTAAADASALRFTPSKARRERNLAEFVEKTRKTDKASAADLERLFASGDIIEKLAPLIRPLGLSVDNLADAYAIWWISAWNATQGANPDPSRAMSQAVRAQAAGALATTPAIAGAGDAAKQQFAEALLVQMILVDTAVEQNKANPSRLRALAVAVSQGARQMGLDLSAMQLTETGFVPAR